MQIINQNVNELKFYTPYNKRNKSIAFSAAPGKFINPHANNQKIELTNSLIPIIEKGSGFAKGIKNTIKQIFPDINFQLGNVSDLSYTTVNKEMPLVFARTSFKNEKPLTFLYFNFPEIISIAASKSRKQYEGLTESIADTVALANETHFISKVVNKCSSSMSEVNNVSLNVVKNVIEDCLKTFGINIDNVILDKKEAEKTYELARKSPNPVTIVNNDRSNVETKLCLIMDSTPHELKKAVSHEFTHTLNANSVWINGVFKDLWNMDNVPLAQLSYGSNFKDIYESDTDFLKKTVSVRGEAYEKLLKATLDKVTTKRDKELVFEQILSNVSDEAFAYSQTPNLFNDYKNREIINGQLVEQIPIGLFFIDFYDFLLSMKNNDKLYLKL